RADALVLAIGMYPVGEEDDVRVALEVDPERRAGEAEMADGARAHPRAGGRPRRRRRVPAEGPGRVRRRAVAGPEALDERRGQRLILAARARAQPADHGVDVARGREQPGMAGDAADRPRVVVVHLAAQDLLAPGALLGGSDRVGVGRELVAAQPSQVDEAGGTQAERTEEPLVADAVERRLRHQLDQLAQEQEPEVAVHALRAGRVLQALAGDLLVHELAGAAAGDVIRPALRGARDVAVVRPPRRQPGAVREQGAHGEADFPVRAAIRDETGD